MDFPKKLLPFLLISLILSNFINCYEDKESLLKRINFSKQISKYTNNTVNVGASLNRGLMCMANEYIEFGQLLMKIPKKFSMCSHYLFPFKYEILSYLLEISGLKESIGKEQKLSVYLLTYYVLYFMSAPKEDIKNYIKEKKLEQYYKYEDIDEGLRDYFPNEILGAAGLEKEHFDLLNSLGFQSIKGDELEGVFNYVKFKIYNSPHMEMIFPWASDFEKFKWANSIIMSRAFTIRVSEYLSLEGLSKVPNSQIDKWTEKNIKVNKYISPDSMGGSCIIAMIDLCNHYQPQDINERDSRPIIIDTEKGNFLYSVTHPYSPGQEIVYTYTEGPSNLKLYYFYGFVLPNNIFNTLNLQVKEETTLNLQQFSLCKELKCFDGQEKDHTQNPKTHYYKSYLTTINESLLNYGRILHLDKDFDNKTIIKILVNNQIISFDNEIKAWVYYYTRFRHGEFGNQYEIKRFLKNCQRYRNKAKAIEENWTNEQTAVKEWRRNKNFEDLYLLGISYKKISTKHMLGSVNKIIVNAQLELDNLKSIYFKRVEL